MPSLAQGEASATSKTNPALKLQVLESRRTSLGNRSLIFNRVAPPVLPLPPASPPSPSAEEIAAGQTAAAREVLNPSEMLLISATVYDRQVTEIRWFHGSREFRAFSNIDFNYVAGLGTFETETACYSVILGLGNATRAEVEADNQRAIALGWPGSAIKRVPDLTEFSGVRSEYFIENALEGSLPAQATEAVDALHRYFDVNKERLIAAYQRRMADQVERERYLRAHPPVLKDTVINLYAA